MKSAKDFVEQEFSIFIRTGNEEHLIEYTKKVQRDALESAKECLYSISRSNVPLNRNGVECAMEAAINKILESTCL